MMMMIQGFVLYSIEVLRDNGRNFEICYTYTLY